MKNFNFIWKLFVCFINIFKIFYGEHFLDVYRYYWAKVINKYLILNYYHLDKNVIPLMSPHPTPF
jgi:hypothetical protein